VHSFTPGSGSTHLKQRGYYSPLALARFSSSPKVTAGKGFPRQLRGAAAAGSFHGNISPIRSMCGSTWQVMRKGDVVVSCSGGEGNGQGAEEPEDRSEGIKYEKPLSEMTLEDIEALPPMDDFIVDDGSQAVEDIMAEDRRFGFKMRALQV
jgi:hypothetical protein